MYVLYLLSHFDVDTASPNISTFSSAAHALSYCVITASAMIHSHGKWISMALLLIADFAAAFISLLASSQFSHMSPTYSEGN